MTNIDIPDPTEGNPWTWPTGNSTPSAADQSRLNALLAEWNAEKRDGISEGAADRSAQATIIGTIVSGYIQVAQGSLDRAVSRGQYITTAAGAIVTAYTALIGATYSSSSKISEVNFTALIPPVFLGISIVFSVAYIAFLKQAPSPEHLLGLKGRLYAKAESQIARDLDYRVRLFCYWTYGGVRDRSGYLHMSVYALAVGVMLLPISFLNIHGNAGWAIFAAGMVVLLLAYLALLIKHKFRKELQGEDDIRGQTGPCECSGVP